MTTATTEKTAAEQEYDKQIENVTALKAEHAQIRQRKTMAEQDVERLNREIQEAERANADTITLANLRQARTAAKETIDDIKVCEEAFPRELALAEGAVLTALVVCTSEKYNLLTERQSSLLRTLEGLISEAVDTLKMKKALASEQKNLISGIGAQYPFLTPAGACEAIVIELQKRVAILDGSPERPTTMLRLDWTCRFMNRGGDLVE